MCTKYIVWKRNLFWGKIIHCVFFLLIMKVLKFIKGFLCLLRAFFLAFRYLLRSNRKHFNKIYNDFTCNSRHQLFPLRFQTFVKLLLFAILLAGHYSLLFYVQLKYSSSFAYRFALVAFKTINIILISLNNLIPCTRKLMKNNRTLLLFNTIFPDKNKNTTFDNSMSNCKVVKIGSWMWCQINESWGH